jgi:Ice-binding-like
MHLYLILDGVLQQKEPIKSGNSGAQAKNIFWQVAGQATLGRTSHFKGNILSQTSIIFQTGASLNSRALAQTAVVLDRNAITNP